LWGIFANLAFNFCGILLKFGLGRDEKVEIQTVGQVNLKARGTA